MSQATQNHHGAIPKQDRPVYADELIASGFLKYADQAKTDSLKTQLTKSFDIYDNANFKTVHIDAEELAEFSFDFFLPQLNAILAKRNLHLSVQQIRDKQSPFAALINGNTVRLYTQRDLNNNTFWDKASRNFFKAVNGIFRVQNCNEQFYLIYEGNDLQAILLTEQQFAIIVDYYRDNDMEKPYRP